MRIGKGPPFVTSLLHCHHDPVIGRTRNVANGWPKADAKLAQGFCVPSYFQGTPEEARAMHEDLRDLIVSIYGDPQFRWEMNNNMVAGCEIAGWQVVVRGAFVADSGSRDNNSRYRKTGIESTSRCEPLK